MYMYAFLNLPATAKFEALTLNLMLRDSKAEEEGDQIRRVELLDVGHPSTDISALLEKSRLMSEKMKELGPKD